MIEIKPYNNNYIEFDTLDSEIFYALKRYYTFEISKFAVKKRYTWQRHKNPTICLVKKNRFLPYGLLNDLIEFLVKNDYKFKISKSLLKKSKISMEVLKKFIDKLSLPFEPHEHQLDGIINSIKNKRITLKSATSSGKSLIIYVLCMLYNKIKRDNEKILLIVPNVQLVGQMFEDFCEYAEQSNINVPNITKMFHGGTDKNFNKEILVSTYQTLIKHDKEFFKQFRYVLVDEAHSSKSKSIMTILDACVNADHRIGMTGSLFGTSTNENILNDKNIVGLLGPIYNVISARELIDKKLAAPIDIKLKIIDWGKKIYDYNIEKEVKMIVDNKHMSKNEKTRKIKSIKEDLYRKERVSIFNSKKRDKIIYDLINQNIDNNALIVFSERDYGRRISENLKEQYPNKNIFHVDGNIKVADRDKLKKSMENSTNNIGVVSVGTFKQGISIKNLHYIVLAQVGKAQISLIQLLGRGMRLHDSKEKIVIFDIIDKLKYIDENGNMKKNGYLQKHSSKRLKIYKSEKHPIEILK